MFVWDSEKPNALSEDRSAKALQAYLLCQYRRCSAWRGSHVVVQSSSKDVTEKVNDKRPNQDVKMCSAFTAKPSGQVVKIIT